MIRAPAVERTALPLPLVRRGKVRDIYDVGENRLLIVATDRISAFDVVLRQPIPHKGAVLTQLTAWWLAQMTDLVPNHLISSNADRIVKDVPALETTRAVWARRSMLVRTTEVVPIECVVRGFISGSAWKEYSEAGTLGGERLPEGLTESASIDPPIFSPSTKAEEGHDENIPFSRMCEEIGRDLATTLRDISLAIYERGRQIAQDAGIILADTKFEFGKLPDGTLLLIDEVLTPDSSRFWPAASYAPGRGQPSLDKQPVRDYLDQLVQKSEWNREPPPPDLPPEVVRATSERYLDAFRQLTGMPLDQFRATDP